MKTVCGLLLLAFLYGCQKLNTSYNIFVRFNVPSTLKRTLILTDKTGAIVVTYNIPTGAVEFETELNISNPPEATYDYHVVYGDATHNGAIRLLTHLSVPSGAPVYFYNKSGISTPFPQPKVIVIDQVESVEEVDIPYIPSVNWNDWNYYPAQKRLFGKMNLQQQEGFLFRMRANYSAGFHSLLIQGNPLQDTVFCNWSDFTPENNRQKIELPIPNQENCRLQVDVLSADQRGFARIYDESGFSDPLQFAQVHFPPSVGATTPVRIFAVYGNAMSERLFQWGEPLVFRLPSIGILETKVVSESRGIQVETVGDVDMIEVQLELSSGNSTFNWTIAGQPGAFEQYEIPLLHTYLPSWLEYSRIFDRKFGVFAYRYGMIDYPELRNGFPRRNTSALFPFATSDYTRVARWH